MFFTVIFISSLLFPFLILFCSSIISDLSYFSVFAVSFFVFSLSIHPWVSRHSDDVMQYETLMLGFFFYYLSLLYHWSLQVVIEWFFQICFSLHFSSSQLVNGLLTFSKSELDGETYTEFVSCSQQLLTSILLVWSSSKSLSYSYFTL